MKNDLISIIIPIYNGEKYLFKCICSVVNSDYKNIEIILVNDGSSDNSENICISFCNKDRRIKYYKKKNGGIASSRQYGISKANGKYICFVDQDDLVYKNTYLLLKKNIEINDSDICIGNFEFLKGNKKTKFYKNSKELSFKKNDINSYILGLCNKCLKVEYLNCHKKYSATIWNCIYKKEIIDKNKIKFKSFLNYEDDLLFNLDYLKNCNNISFETKSVYIWRQNFKSESHKQKYVEDYYDKNKKINNYIVKTIRNFENFNLNKWNNNFEIVNCYLTIVNESNKNQKYSKELIKKISNICNENKENFDKFTCCFNAESTLKSSKYITTRKLKKCKIKSAYYVNKILYNKIIFNIKNFFRIIYYFINGVLYEK